MNGKGSQGGTDDSPGAKVATEKRVVVLPHGQQAAGGNDQQKTADSQWENRRHRRFAEKKNAAQQAEKRKPECTDAEQSHENPGKIRTEDAEKIVNLASSACVEKKTGIFRIKGEEADQTEDDHEEKKDTDDFFFHRVTKTR